MDAHDEDCVMCSLMNVAIDEWHEAVDGFMALLRPVVSRGNLGEIVACLRANDLLANSLSLTDTIDIVHGLLPLNSVSELAVGLANAGARLRFPEVPSF